MTRSIFAATVVAALMSSAPAMAQKLPDGTTVQERADTAKLNAEQLAKADAETARYQQSVSQYEQQKAAIAEQTAAAQAKYADETAAYEAEKAEVGSRCRGLQGGRYQPLCQAAAQGIRPPTGTRSREIERGSDDKSGPLFFGALAFVRWSPFVGV